jgi:ribose transport system substrate-binding protein
MKVGKSPATQQTDSQRCRNEVISLVAPPKHQLAAFVACACILISSCKSAPRQVAIIPQTTATTLWEAEHAGAEAAAKKLGMQTYWNAPTRGDDVQQQIALVHNAINRHYRGLILAPDQPLALMVPVREAIRQGIPTVIVGTSLPMSLDRSLSYIVNDDIATGQVAAAHIGKILGGEGRVAVLGIDPDSPGALEILHSFETTLERNFPRIALVDRRTGSSNESEAQEVANESLAKDPHLNAIFALTAIATRGAYLALHSRSLSSQVKLVGFEQDLELMSLVRDGQINGLIAENTYQMGYQAMELIARSRGTQQVGEQIKLAPKLLTADNADSPEVQRLISMDWSSIP